MMHIKEAAFTHGVLKPTVDLYLRDQQRVRVIVEPIEDGPAHRDAVVARLKAGSRVCSPCRTGQCPGGRTRSTVS
jgi:predicted DNA-binding antitoxin AbrB/MazE fold protein